MAATIPSNLRQVYPDPETLPVSYEPSDLFRDRMGAQIWLCLQHWDGDAMEVSEDVDHLLSSWMRYFAADCHSLCIQHGVPVRDYYLQMQDFQREFRASLLEWREREGLSLKEAKDAIRRSYHLVCSGDKATVIRRLLLPSKNGEHESIEHVTTFVAPLPEDRPYPIRPSIADVPYIVEASLSESA